MGIPITQTLIYIETYLVFVRTLTVEKEGEVTELEGKRRVTGYITVLFVQVSGAAVVWPCVSAVSVTSSKFPRDQAVSSANIYLIWTIQR